MQRALALILVLVALGFGIHARGQGLLADLFEDGARGARAAHFKIVAENYLKYGLIETGGVPIVNPQRVEAEQFVYQVNHPPGTALLAWIGAALGGSNPAALRLTFLLFSIGIVLLVYRLARRRHPLARASAALFAALVPVAVYYGAFVDHAIPTLFFVLLTVHLFLRWLRRGRTKDRTRAVLACAAAVGCDWVAVLAPAALLALLPLRAQGTARSPTGKPLAGARGALVLLGVAVAVFTLVRVQYLMQLGRFGAASDAEAARFLPDVLGRSALASGAAAADLFARVGSALPELFGLPLLGLALLGLVSSVVALARRRLRDVDVATLVLLCIAAANLVLFTARSPDREYDLLYLVPPAALAASAAADFLLGRARPDATPAWRVAAVAGALVLLGGALLADAREVVSRRLTYEAGERGRRIRDLVTEQHTIVFVPPSPGFLQLSAAAGNLAVECAGSPDELDHRIGRLKAQGMAGRPVLFLVEVGEALDGDLLARLSSHRDARLGDFTAYDLGMVRAQ